MKIEALKDRFTVCRTESLRQVDPDLPYVFTARTEDEISLVCPTEHVPENTLQREDGWRGFRVCGVLDFSLVGILARISGALAEAGIPLFALSTYNTDYIFVKEDHFERAVALAEAL